ncbi:hypothetical protein GCM10011385_25180 [Nitratireductor aestuarii]|uniref:DUF2937 domain-containing protein n=1 Tax=Nitratireductor aestuarii TaxID=1735103 RepID=A0A916W687_9HYPH|nr:hypothetical protein GCM10011385_25180 [Nitratireductor aestuarii]
MRPGRILTLLTVCAGAVLASQAPEFAQQYRQRLGGAIEELAVVIADFDADATRNNLNREQALDVHRRAQEPFLKDRGVSMETAIRRLDRLSLQAKEFETLPPLLRPVAIAYGPDQRLLDGTLRDFEPAVPVTPHGAVWTGAGALLAYLIAKLFGLPFRRKRRANARHLVR